MKRNGKNWEETGRNGKGKRKRKRKSKMKKTTSSIDDNNITEPLRRGRTRKQENRQTRIAISIPSPQFLVLSKNTNKSS